MGTVGACMVMVGARMGKVGALMVTHRGSAIEATMVSMRERERARYVGAQALDARIPGV